MKSIVIIVLGLVLAIHFNSSILLVSKRLHCHSIVIGIDNSFYTYC